MNLLLVLLATHSLAADHAGTDWGGADLLLANILAKPLLELRPLFARLVRPGGTAVLSGLLGHQGDAVAAAYAADFVIVHREIDADWACLELRRKTRDRNLHHPAPSVQRP